MLNNLNKIFNIDCIEYMKSLPNDCIDLIIADVPYNIGKKYGDFIDKVSHSDYIELINKWVTEFHRILKPQGSLFIYTGKQYYPYYYIEINNIFTIQNQIIWNYDSSSMQTKKKYDTRQRSGATPACSSA